jgi:cell wall-associated NlpC family hydrolase
MEQEVWMVGRLPAASLLSLLAAALAVPAPLTAEPAHLLLTPLAPLALADHLVAFEESARSGGRTGAGPASPAAEVAAPAPAALPEAALDAGEYGVEYQLSVRDAESFLNRLSARWQRLVEQAMTYLGTPYRRGGTSRRGLDCSGLVGAVYGEEGLGMPRTALQQFGEGVPVAERDLRPGDLVFFRDTYKRGISHVGIFIGDGHFVHAAGHRRGVVVSELSRPYYHLRYAGARRLAAEPTAASGRRQASPDVAGLAAPPSAPEPAAAAAPSAVSPLAAAPDSAAPDSSAPASAAPGERPDQP